MNRCSACKHWGEEADAPDSPMSLRLDMNDDYPEPAPVAPHRKCLKVVHLHTEGTSMTDVTRPAYLMDPSGYRADIWTRPEFGCAEFEGKEA